ncbi:hypothetical protein N9294_01035 [bacterium]|nr:hypothetical protein [bacterium]
MKLLLLLFYFLAAKEVEVQMAGPQLQAVPGEVAPRVEIPAAPVRPAQKAPKGERRIPQRKAIHEIPIQPAEKKPEAGEGE